MVGIYLSYPGVYQGGYIPPAIPGCTMAGVYLPTIPGWYIPWCTPLLLHHPGYTMVYTLCTSNSAAASVGTGCGEKRPWAQLRREEVGMRRIEASLVLRCVDWWEPLRRVTPLFP